jgi:iron(III) transport system ATP-binding protein
VNHANEPDRTSSAAVNTAGRPVGERAGISVTNLVKSYGTVTVVHGISFDVGPGEFVTLLGPSGCGKTTTLRCIAGLEETDGGVITIAGQTVSAPERGVFVPPHERSLGMVFQSYAIWPHMTVADNVAFPLQTRGVKDSAKDVAWALDVVGMGQFAQRRPSELSGGQQQRVALARAIVGRPKVLLFDEPLSNLDARLRDRTRAEISRIQKELAIPAVYVTHDQAEALSMSDRVIVMDHGRIMQQGAPRELYRRPVNRFVADFVGAANFLPLRADGRAGWLGPDGSPVVADVGSREAEGERVAVLRPEAITLMPGDAGPPSGSNALRGIVTASLYMGPHDECLVDVAGTPLRAFSARQYAPGSAVTVAFQAEDCHLLADR